MKTIIILAHPNIEQSYINKSWIEALSKTKPEAEALVNPLKGNIDSIARGKRLWGVNCLPCHGAHGF